MHFVFSLWCTRSDHFSSLVLLGLDCSRRQDLVSVPSCVWAGSLALHVGIHAFFSVWKFCFVLSCGRIARHWCPKRGLTPSSVLAPAVAWSRSTFPDRRLLGPLARAHFPAEYFAHCPGPDWVHFSCSPLLLVPVRPPDPDHASIATAVTRFLAAVDSPVRNFVLDSFSICSHRFSLEPSARDHLIFLIVSLSSNWNAK
jgi:hypothetical protein